MNEHEHEPEDAKLNGDSVEVEIPEMTAPVFPTESTLTNSHTFFQRTVGGGMTLKFVPLIALPDGRTLPDTHATCVQFSAEGWERFKRSIAADGVESRIVTARGFPEGFIRGEG